jgi:hypothetical protein
MVNTGYNHTVLIGHISSGPWRNPGSHDKAESAAFTLAIPEPGRDGKLYQTYVRIECYGRLASEASALASDDVVLCESKLSWKITGEG